MKRWIILGLLALGAIVSVFALRPCGPDQEVIPRLDATGVQELTHHRGSRALEERTRVAKEFMAFRGLLRTELFAVMQEADQDGEEAGPQMLAIELAGLYRIEEIDVTKFLAENITLRSQSGALNSTVMDLYPCAFALARIGLPGVKAVIVRLNTSESITAEEAKCFAAVLWHVDGPELGAYRLRQFQDVGRPEVYNAVLAELGQ